MPTAEIRALLTPTGQGTAAVWIGDHRTARLLWTGHLPAGNAHQALATLAHDTAGLTPDGTCMVRIRTGSTVHTLLYPGWTTAPAPARRPRRRRDRPQRQHTTASR